MQFSSRARFGGSKQVDRVAKAKTVDGPAVTRNPGASEQARRGLSHQLLAQRFGKRTAPLLEHLAVFGALETGQVDFDATGSVVKHERHTTTVGANGDPTSFGRCVAFTVGDLSLLLLFVRPVKADHVVHDHALVSVHVHRHSTRSTWSNLADEFGVAHRC